MANDDGEPEVEITSEEIIESGLIASPPTIQAGILDLHESSKVWVRRRVETLEFIDGRTVCRTIDLHVDLAEEAGKT